MYLSDLLNLDIHKETPSEDIRMCPGKKYDTKITCTIPAADKYPVLSQTNFIERVNDFIVVEWAIV